MRGERGGTLYPLPITVLLLHLDDPRVVFR